MIHFNKKLVLLFCIPIIFGIGFLYATNINEDNKNPPIKIAISLWIGDAHAFIAKDLGIFEKNGIDVELMYFEDYPDAQQAYQSGNADGLFATMSDVIFYNAGTLQSKIVYVTDYSKDADVIVGNMKSFDEIKGRTISVENMNSYSHIFVLAALEKIGLSENDVYFQVVPAHDVVQSLNAGIIDAGHTWEPSISDAQKNGYNVLFTANEIPGIITSTLILRSNVIEQRPEDVGKIVQSLVEAQEYRDANWEHSLEIMAKHLDLTTHDVQLGFEGIHTLDLDENIDVFTSNATQKNVDFVSEFYVSRGQLKKIPQLEELFDGRFVTRLGIK